MHVISFSADGDSRLLTAMCLASKLYGYSSTRFPNVEITQMPLSSTVVLPSSWDKWFAITKLSSLIFVQNTVHVGVKLKARLLTHSQVLPLGNYSAESTHLNLLNALFHKEQHNLRMKDLSHEDRQNFEAVLRLTSPNVLSLLGEIPDAKGTKFYLEVTKNIADSYLNKELG